ncbi:MAG: hypothetical protein ACR2HG_14860 [Pyrinomonadaceae bacterium]
MQLIDLIIDILDNADSPLQQKEITELALAHSNSSSCPELIRVEFPASAVARTLSKYSVGANPIIGIHSEKRDKVSFKKFYLQSKSYQDIHTLAEIELHPYLVKFVFERYNIFSKTINALKSNYTRNKIGKWTNPDVVGINPLILNLSPLFQDEVKKLGLFSTKVIEFFSFELKIKIDKSNITEAYFQAVSNSSWANYGYLVVEDLDMSKDFLENLTRLNNGYGIGVIKLNLINPVNSEIIISARQREIVDINFMNFLSASNNDFYEFVKNTIGIIESKKIKPQAFDKIKKF